MEMHEKVALLHLVEFFNESDDEIDLQFCISSSSSEESEEDEINNIYIAVGLVQNELRGQMQIRPRIKDPRSRVFDVTQSRCSQCLISQPEAL